MSEEIKRCPFCAEEILAAAKKCKHCGSNLDDPDISKKLILSKSETNYELFLLAIPVVATMFIWFWVSRLSLFESPEEKLVLIMLITVIGTAIIAAMEASKVGMKPDREKDTYSPTAWFFYIIILWIVMYPRYLFKRKDYSLANRLAAGIVVALIFVGSSIIMIFAIEAKKAEVRNRIEQIWYQSE